MSTADASRIKAVLFLGSGFSVPYGLPTTSALGKTLLEEDDREEKVLGSFISQRIGDFWGTVFGWRAGMRPPTLEDHFTQIDLAANSGHFLGPKYGPKELRAIRRMTIHRIFTRLKSSGFQVDRISKLFRTLSEKFEIDLVTTNWDVEAESCLESLGIAFNHGEDEIVGTNRRPPAKGVRVLKLHGCVNLGYCDCCRVPVRFRGLGEAVTSLELLLKEEDLLVFKGDEMVARQAEPEGWIWPRVRAAARQCPACGAWLGARVGTFSYRKDFNPYAFYDTWSNAQTSLQAAQKWLFVGYSLPDADIDIRHLLKSAQLARPRSSTISIDVVLMNDCEAGERYQRFFGLPQDRVFQDGIEKWSEERLAEFCLEKSM